MPMASPERDSASASEPSTRARSSSSRAARTERSMVTCTEIRLSTMTLPLRSRIRPRGASTGTVRVLIDSAATSYWLAVITWRYQRRANSAANSDTATTPRIERRRRGLSPFTGTPRERGRCPACRWPTAAARIVGAADHGVEQGHDDRDLRDVDAEELDTHDGPEHDVQDDTQGAPSGRGGDRDPPGRPQHAVLQRADHVGHQRVAERRQAGGGLEQQVVRASR